MKTRRIYLFFGLAFLAMWIALCIAPCWYYRSGLDAFKVGGAPPWGENHRWFFDIYYSVGVVGGWHLLLALGLFSVFLSLTANFKNHYYASVLIGAFSIAAVFLFSASFGCVQAILAVLE